jgi:hypothetical protein
MCGSKNKTGHQVKNSVVRPLHEVVTHFTTHSAYILHAKYALNNKFFRKIK